MRNTTGRCLSLLCCAVLLAGCGGDERSGADAGGPESATSTAPSEAPTPSEPSVEPASGKRVRLGSLALRFPQGYEPRRTNAGVLGVKTATASGPGGQSVSFGISRSLGPVTLDELVEMARVSAFWSSRPKRLDDVDVAGVMMYHLRGRVGANFTKEQVGAESGGYDVVFSVVTAGSGREREELLASIIATAEWP